MGNKYDKNKKEKFLAQPFEQPQGEEYSFSKITKYMYNHKVYLSLSPYAMVVLGYMKICAFEQSVYWKSREEKGFGIFKFSKQRIVEEFGYAESKAKECLKELEQKGFITRQNGMYGSQTAEWSFSDRWFRGNGNGYDEMW